MHFGIGADTALPPVREIEPTTSPPEIPVREPRLPVPPRTEPPRARNAAAPNRAGAGVAGAPAAGAATTGAAGRKLRTSMNVSAPQ